jgi:hypothetical protein
VGDLLSRGARWLGEQFERHLSRTVRYTRSGAACSIRATLGRTEYQVDDTSGMVLRYTDRDYIFRADRLVLDGGRTLPAPGDRIEELDGEDGTLKTYEVMPLGDSQCYRFCDPQRHVLRVHTKLIETT